MTKMLPNYIREKILNQEHGFLNNYILNNKIVLLGLGGSYAYGTNTENSDLDIRGVATHEDLRMVNI